VKSFNKTPLALGLSSVLVLLASTSAHAISTGTDLNLSAKARAGGMAGAAYTMPQEASAAVFGNPATLTQFQGINMNFGASFLSLSEIDVESTSHVPATASVLDGRSHSDADNYIVPDFGLTIQVAPNLVLGTGLEVDAGLGADYRDDPIANLLPLTVELISFNANLAAAYEVNDKLSVGGALTIGFALAQLGTSGSVTTFSGVETGFLPTSSVHDIGLGGSLGATYKIQEGIMVSAAWKSKVQYNFKNILQNSHANGLDSLTAGGYQDLTLEQPAEVVIGVAFDNVLAEGLLVEMDVIWKNWEDASTYEDAYDDQFLYVIGAQYDMGNITLRAGYSYADDILNSNPGDTLHDLDVINPLDASGQDVVKIAQYTLLPTIWNHTITAGIGYQITDAVSVDAYAAYAFGEDETTTVTVLTTNGLDLESKIDYELMVGAGINIALP